MADALAGTFSTLELLPEGVSGRDLYKEILAVNTEGLEGFSTQYGPEILCYETEDAGQPLYQMNLYAPGYYTDGE